MTISPEQIRRLRETDLLKLIDDCRLEYGMAYSDAARMEWLRQMREYVDILLKLLYRNPE